MRDLLLSKIDDPCKDEPKEVMEFVQQQDEFLNAHPTNKAFSIIDTNRSGRISLSEWMAGCRSLGVEPEGARKVFAHLDTKMEGGGQNKETETFNP